MNNSIISKFNNLKDYLQNAEGLTAEDFEGVTPETAYNEIYNSFEVCGCEYLVFTDEEADEATAAEIKESLWAFNPDFILRHTKVYNETTDREDQAIIEALREVQSRICETANALVMALIEDLDAFISDAVDADGRGHFLARYDGEEIESGEFYIYRIN